MLQPITDLDRTIAARLRALRIERKLTQPRVAEFLGIAYQSYQKLEAGKVSFRASTLIKLADLLNAQINYFTEGAGSPLKNGVEIANAVAIMADMSTSDADAVRHFALTLKNSRRR